MRIGLLTALLLGEVLAIHETSAEVMIGEQQEGGNIRYVNKMLSLDEFPCNPYPNMLFYYTERDELRCGEPEPN